MKKLYLIDTYSLIFRAYYAIKNLSTSNGFKTNAVYGVIKSIQKLLKDFKPDYICAVYDSVGITFRKEMTETYKANRTKAPDDLKAQFPIIEEFLELLGIPSIRIEGLEADDVIGSLIETFYNDFDNFIIITGDKDLFQLIDEKVKIFDPKKGLWFDKEATFEKFGVYPNQMRDYLALVGDASDNIKGAPGIGKKTAAKLLNEYQNIDNIYKNKEKLKEKLQKSLEEFENYKNQSIELVTIKKDAKINLTIDQLRIREIDNNLLLKKLKEYEFYSLIQELALDNKLIHIEIIPFKHFIFDKELFFKIFKDKIFLLNDNKASILPLNNWNSIPKNATFISYGLKEDFKILLSKNMELPINFIDLIISQHIIKGGNKYIQLEEMFNDYPIDKNIEIQNKEKLLINEVETIKKLHIAMQIFSQMKKNVAFPKLLISPLKNIEFPLIPILAQMELNGISIDLNILQEIKRNYRSMLIKIEKDIFELSGEQFNIDSPKQLQQILFIKLGMEPIKKTKTGFSTDNSVLQKLLAKTKNPTYKQLIENIIDYRELSKMINTFLEGFIKYIHKGKIHSIFHQTVTATGRLSSESPNLQNLPIKTERGAILRKMFVPSSPDNSLLSLDYSQIELRVLAHFSQDEQLIEAFKNNVDIHSLTTSKILHIPVEEITKEQRRIGKTLNFGIIYGMGPYHLSQSMKISQKEAEKFIEAYYDTYKGVKEFKEHLIKKALETGVVETLFHRRRYIPELLSENKQQKNAAIRAAINAPIQGTASEIIKLAMIEIYKRNFPIKLILQIHDELVFDGKAELISQYAKEIASIMENVVQLSIPLKVDYKIGKNLFEIH